MSYSAATEARALDAEERELVAQTHHPAVQALSDAELAALVRRVRERRDRAQALAREQRREIRGKSRPRGTAAATADHGSVVKADVLAQAMRRLNAEASRRQRMATRLGMVASQKRALDMVQALEKPHHAFNTRTAHDGMRKNPNPKARRIGSALEAGRVSQFVRDAQARRDSR